MIKCNRLPFFEIFSNFIHFCQIFEYFALFQHFFALFLENPIHAVNFQNSPRLYFLVNQEFEQTESILGILVNNPHNFEVTEKPVGLGKRENTISRVPGIEKKKQIVSVKTDRNDAHNKKGNMQKFHFFNGSVCQIAHLAQCTWCSEFNISERICFI